MDARDEMRRGALEEAMHVLFEGTDEADGLKLALRIWAEADGAYGSWLSVARASTGASVQVIVPGNARSLDALRGSTRVWGGEREMVAAAEPFVRRGVRDAAERARLEAASEPDREPQGFSPRGMPSASTTA